MKKIISFDGLLIPASYALIQGLRPGIMKGRGVFETMRVYEGKIFAVEAHVCRLMQGLKVLGLNSPFSGRQLKKHIEEVIQKNRFRDARVRLSVWKERRKMHTAIIATPYIPPSPDQYERGFHAIISDIVRDEKSPFSRIKSINYLPFLQSWRKARQRGNDEAILLNRKGYVVEGSRTNIFIVKKGVLLTPSIATGCLPGITRRIILSIAATLKIKTRQGAFKVKDIYLADEAFLTNSLLEVIPLTLFQGHIVGLGRSGSISKILRRAYRQYVQEYIKRI